MPQPSSVGVALVGTPLQKRFGRELFQGKVTSFEDDLYHVLYEDGDEEDLLIEEVDELRLPGKSTITGPP